MFGGSTGVRGIADPDYYLIGILIIALIACVTIFHHQIVSFLRPESEKIRHLSWGWVIPVAILFVLSFPPLFGAEIVAVLCGIVYGVWIGFGIVALGTLLGEIGNFYAFRYLLQSHAIKAERKSMSYACLAEIIRNGGFWVRTMADPDCALDASLRCAGPPHDRCLCNGRHEVLDLSAGRHSVVAQVLERCLPRCLSLIHI